MNISDDDQRKIVKWARRNPEVKEVYLYGSRARCDNDPHSDIDLGIVMNVMPGNSNASATWMDWFPRYKKNPDLQLSYQVQLEFYEKSAGLDKVGPGVEQDGIRIYSEDGETAD